eukprot:11930130-Prorocentrum_lima.AAC.1
MFQALAHSFAASLGQRTAAEHLAAVPWTTDESTCIRSLGTYLKGSVEQWFRLPETALRALGYQRTYRRLKT